MTNEISSERRVEASVGRIAAMMRHIRQRGLKIAFVAGPVVVHTGGGAVLHRADPARLRGRPALWQCPGGARRRAVAVRHVARRRSRGGHAGSRRSPPSHARHQRHQRGRRHPRRRRGRRPEERSDGRVRSAGCPLRPCRQHPRRRSDCRYGDGHGRRAGPVCGGARRESAW